MDSLNGKVKLYIRQHIIKYNWNQQLILELSLPWTPQIKISSALRSKYVVTINWYQEKGREDLQFIVWGTEEGLQVEYRN